MINTRGRVVWVDNDRIEELKKLQWIYFPNPTETYYPQYDQNTGKVTRTTHIVPEINGGEILQVEIL